MSIVVFDLETTGTDPWNDRIISLYASNGRQEISMTFDPEMPIPPEATAVHGIRNEDVAGHPTFRMMADRVGYFFLGAILCGYNSRRYDTIMLHAEFVRAGIEPPYDLATVQELDVFQIWRSIETQNLASACRRWLDREPSGAHSAKADAEDAWEVLRVIQKKHDLTIEECINRSMLIERSSSLIRKDGEWHFAFGMHRGKPCKDHPDYLQWMSGAKFDKETMRIVKELLL